MVRYSRILLTLTALGMVYPSWAQQPGLADVARREADRRKDVKTPGKVYTNQDVKSSGGAMTTVAAAQQPAVDSAAAGASAGTPAGATTGAPTPSASAAKPDAPSSKPDGEQAAKDEAWWRKQMAELQDQRNRNRLFGDALQSRINALWADFTARDDPAQRSVLERDRNEALAELERVKKETARLEQAIEDLEEDARKANVPAGWLR